MESEFVTSARNRQGWTLCVGRRVVLETDTLVASYVSATGTFGYDNRGHLIKIDPK